MLPITSGLYKAFPRKRPLYRLLSFTSKLYRAFPRKKFALHNAPTYCRAWQSVPTKRLATMNNVALSVPSAKHLRKMVWNASKRAPSVKRGIHLEHHMGEKQKHNLPQIRDNLLALREKHLNRWLTLMVQYEYRNRWLSVSPSILFGFKFINASAQVHKPSPISSYPYHSSALQPYIFIHSFH